MLGGSDLSNPFGLLYGKCFHLIATYTHEPIQEAHMENLNGCAKLSNPFWAQPMDASVWNNTKSILNLDIEMHYKYAFSPHSRLEFYFRENNWVFYLLLLVVAIGAFFQCHWIDSFFSHWGDLWPRHWPYHLWHCRYFPPFCGYDMLQLPDWSACFMIIFIQIIDIYFYLYTTA